MVASPVTITTLSQIGSLRSSTQERINDSRINFSACPANFDKPCVEAKSYLWMNAAVCSCVTPIQAKRTRAATRSALT